MEKIYTFFINRFKSRTDAEFNTGLIKRKLFLERRKPTKKSFSRRDRFNFLSEHNKVLNYVIRIPHFVKH